MKKLVIVRHAKSSWKHNVIDFERPLNNRGLSDAALISEHHFFETFQPDLILSSDAKRARTTAQIFIDSLKLHHVDFQLNNKLYDFAGNDLIEVIKNCDNSVNNLMVFGHNYAITSFVNFYGSLPIDNVPTSGLVCITFPIDDWKDLSPGECSFKVFPKDLK